MRHRYFGLSIAAEDGGNGRYQRLKKGKKEIRSENTPPHPKHLSAQLHHFHQTEMGEQGKHAAHHEAERQPAENGVKAASEASSFFFAPSRWLMKMLAPVLITV